MNFISPKVTAENVAAATETNFAPRTVVEAGEYTMRIQSAPIVLTSKAGNQYLQLMLVHTNDEINGKAIYPNFNANEIGSKQLTQLLLALGFGASEVASDGTGWGIEDGAGAGPKDGSTIATIKVAGETVDLAGREVSVYLTKKLEEFNGKTTEKNSVARFIIK